MVVLKDLQGLKEIKNVNEKVIFIIDDDRKILEILKEFIKENFPKKIVKTFQEGRTASTPASLLGGFLLSTIFNVYF